MVYGIGIDIVQTNRMRDAVERWGERFLKKIFTDDEIVYCYSKKDPYIYLSVRFAAKEAFIKAVSCNRYLSMTDMEVRNQPGGKPVMELHGETAMIARESGIGRILLSMSHEKEYCVASVVIEEKL